MQFSIRYLPRGRNAVPEEAATVAELWIRVGERIATEHTSPENGQRLPFVVIPAYPLAEGLAARWWQIMAGRGRAHSLRRMRSGFAIPDVVFVGDGSNMRVTTRPFRYENPSLIFDVEAEEVLPISMFGSAVTLFVEGVLQRLRDENIAGTELEQQWARIEASHGDPGELAFCEAAGALDIDPYRCDEEQTVLIERLTCSRKTGAREARKF